MTDELEDQRCKYLHGQPTNLTVDQKFRLLLKMLRRDFPPEHPVKVRRVDGKKIGPEEPHGICWLVNSDKPKEQRYFLIRIKKQDILTMQIDTLIHEWAHTLTWYQLPYGKDHGDVFARKYGVLYRAYMED